MLELIIVFLTFASALALALFLVWRYILWQRNKWRMTEGQLEETCRQLNIKAAENLDVALADWLMTLKLPQLEDQTIRLKAAHQLRTALIEKLLLSQNPC